jgi:hypothetical protein
MHFRLYLVPIVPIVALLVSTSPAQQASQGQSSSSKTSSSSSQHVRKSASGAGSPLDAGSVSDGVYRNQGFGFTCKIPAAWVLRTEEMNEQEEEDTNPDGSAPSADAGKAERVLLATFSRPPEARAEDVNSSILIAAESAASYPGLKDAAQYLGPVTEVAKAQGFVVEEEPYEFVIGDQDSGARRFSEGRWDAGDAAIDAGDAGARVRGLLHVYWRDGGRSGGTD